MKTAILRLFSALFLCLCAGYALAVSSEPVRLEHTTASLHTAYDRVSPDESFYVLFHLKIDPEWHTYWINPGDSGLPTRLKWELPAGWQAGEIIWQPPLQLPYGPLVNYGYDGDAYHLVRIVPPADAAAGGQAELKVRGDWLVCKEECIPESVEIAVTADLGKPLPSETYEWIERLRESAALPVVEGVAARAGEGGEFTLELPLQAIDFADVREAYFFSAEPGSVEPAARQELRKDTDTLWLTVKEAAIALPETLSGIIELRDGGGKLARRQVELTQGVLSVPDEKRLAITGEQPAIATPDGGEFSWALALVFAFIGGFILNAMPCVFPVLSLKALGLSKKSAKERKHVRAHGYSYTAGVVGSFALVGLLLILLKAAGGAVGWGYQMQSPYFVAALTYLLFLIGLNLAGYFDVIFHMSVNTSTGEKETLRGSFAMGALVTLVATPCSAPFMATALGAALTQPPAIGMAIFLVMGFGLALPYLLLTTIPGALKWLPKPGLWMERFKQFLSFPMFLSAIWLLWVFSLQAGPDATALLLSGLTALALALWLGKAWKARGSAGKILRIVLIAGIALLPLLLLPGSIRQPAGNTQEIDGAVNNIPYDEELLDGLRKEGKPVFVYATAAWCITCKVNERAALDSIEVREHFAQQGVEVMVADWTNEDERITRFLSRFGRAGVPLYVFFPADGSSPRILPQLLTPSIVIDSVS